MFERVNAFHSAFPSVSLATVVSAVHTGITMGVLVVGAAWVANSGYGEAADFPANADGWIAVAVQRAPETSAAPIFEPAVQDTIFIVGSDAEANSLRALLVEDSAIRNTLALAPLRDEVLVATSDEEAAALAEALREGNKILAGLAQPEIRVVNLRTP